MKKILSILILPLWPLAAFAQKTDFNPTVQVVNSYENKLVNMDRYMHKLPVPDSLYHFDLNFDYSGFDTPYKGNSEFNPFFTDIEMSGRPYDGRKFYLKAGAGYCFAPFLDLYYTMKDSGKFNIGLHANADGFYGFNDYFQTIDGKILLQDKSHWTGFDAKAVAGFDATVDWESYSMLFNLDYEGALGSSLPNEVNITAGTNPAGLRNYQGMNASWGVITKYDTRKRFVFSSDLAYSFGWSNYGPSAAKPVVSYEHNPRLRMLGHYNFKSGSALDLELMGNFTMNLPGSTGKQAYGFTGIVNPRYYFNSRKVHFGLGAAILVDGGKNIATAPGTALPFALWPTLDFLWSAVRDKLDLYVRSEITGYMYGDRMNALENRIYVPYEKDYGFSNVRHMNSKMGMRGCLGRKFNYDLHAGFNLYENEPAFIVKGSYQPNGGVLSMIHEEMRIIHAGASFDGTFGGFNISGDVNYNHFLTSSRMLAIPSALTANLDMKYTILGRIGLGVGAEYRSPYRAGDYTTPFFLDLHALFDYKITGSFSIFAKGSNLLNRSMQYIPMYSHHGFCITAGVVLNL